MLPIILSIADDDDRAFVEKIYDKYEKKLYLISMDILHDHYDAQDCVHDTITSVIERIEKFKLAQGTGYLDNLMEKACHNCAISIYRVKSRKNKHEQSLVKYNCDEEIYEDIDIPDYASAVDKIYISEENCEILHDLINKLDNRYRDVVLLKSLGFDNKNIAEIMKISEELVRKRYSRAKKKLWEIGGKDLYVK